MGDKIEDAKNKADTTRANDSETRTRANMERYRKGQWGLGPVSIRLGPKVFKPAYASAHPVPLTGSIKPEDRSEKEADLTWWMRALRRSGMITGPKGFGPFDAATDPTAYSHMVENRKKLTVPVTIAAVGAAGLQASILSAAVLGTPVLPIAAGAIVGGVVWAGNAFTKKREYIHARYGGIGEQIDLNRANHLIPRTIGNLYRVSNYAVSHVVPLTTDLDWRRLHNGTVGGVAKTTFSTMSNLARGALNDIGRGEGPVGRVLVKISKLDDKFDQFGPVGKILNFVDGLGKAMVGPAKSKA